MNVNILLFKLLNNIMYCTHQVGDFLLGGGGGVVAIVKGTAVINGKVAEPNLSY